MLWEPALAEERLEHGGLRLLELEEQRVVVIAAHQKKDPRASPDAADADDLPCGVHVSVALEQVAPVAWKRAPVGANHAPRDVLEFVLFRTFLYVFDGRDDGRVADDPQPAVATSTQLREGSQAVLRMHVRDVRLEALHPLLGRCPSQLLEDALDFEARVPDLDVAQRREACYRLAVLAHGRHDERTACHVVEAELTTRDREARGEALHVPLERPR